MKYYAALLLSLCAFAECSAQKCDSGVLDPRVAAVLRDSIKDLVPKLNRTSIEEGKQTMLTRTTSFPESDVALKQVTTDSIPLYIFNATHETNLPVIVYYHPGGFVTGFLPFMKEECWRMSKQMRAVVFAVDYRIAPDFKFPVAVNDAFNAFKWVTAHAHEWGGDPDKLVVWGMSAGANLAAVISQQARTTNLKGKIKLQVLNCPSLDNKSHQHLYPSYEKYVKGYFQTREFIDFAQQTYATPNDFSKPTFAPMLTEDLRGLPPAVLIIAEFDIFHDENKRYGQRLRDADVPVYEKCYPGQIHCLVGLPPDAPEIQDGLNLVKKAMNVAFKIKR